ncbi:ABC transporter substrate-binding protein [Rossellomorea marisflavi]|uniref:ABC transporter substrate-binding protein n=1 Tax=Rossellomorea marisflavi TaxID=189381 RepID=UPI0020423EEB|nr:ABC transporter substrate-binding protein [Rossellomorea marisflavi]MCM2606214.1 ABC transporter substrate-binding protein [Rossellomorea marisflavi]
MNQLLLKLWRVCPTGEVRIEKVADILELSRKQTTRKMKKWEEDGFLTFSPGKGRGHLSKIEWKVNVEESFEKEAMNRMEHEPMESLSAYFTYDWSPDTRHRLMNLFAARFGYSREGRDKLIIPRRHLFRSFHPLEAADAQSAHLVANLYNRLVSITEMGECLPELAHSWDELPDRLRLYLRKDVRFHDGSTMKAEDVQRCLEKMGKHPIYRELWIPVEDITIPGPLIIEIHHPAGCSYVLQMLSMMCASIYKETAEGPVGTGCFYLGEDTLDKTVLLAFRDHFRERPLLDSVEFVKVEPDFPVHYQSQTEDPASIEVESDSGFGIVVMNAYRDSAIHHKDVRTYLHHILARHRDRIVDFHPRITPIRGGCLKGHEVNPDLPQVPRPDFKSPLIIRATGYTTDSTRWLQQVFDEEGVPYEVRWFTFDEVVTNHPRALESDLFIHGEIFEENEDLSFYHFLINGYSPLHPVLKPLEEWKERLDLYRQTPFTEWRALHEENERKLMEDSLMIPLYHVKRAIPFSTDLMNIHIRHFGYVDFSKMWVRPGAEA